MAPEAAPASGAVAVVYIDTHLIILNKPSGLLSVPGRGPDKQDCLSARVQAQYPDALVVHRLDMATSGLIVMARGAAVQRALSGAFSNRLVHKTYEAVVSGVMACDGSLWHTIDLPIAVDWPNRPLRTINHDIGQASQTRYRVLDTNAHAATTHLALEPLTGRTHQLRVHLQAIGHPILGDALYAPPAVLAQAPRLLLHASHVTLSHPMDGRALHFTCAAAF
jgi:tRNA pseudouridine32 synthase/23S rRNA pseudouridine746 synthase